MPEFSRRGVAGVSSFWNSAPRFSFFTGGPARIIDVPSGSGTMSPLRQSWATVEEAVCTDSAIWISKLSSTPQSEEYQDLIHAISIPPVSKGHVTVKIGKLFWELSPPSGYIACCEKKDDWELVPYSGFQVALLLSNRTRRLQVWPCSEQVQLLRTKALLPSSLENLGLSEKKSLGREGSINLDIDDDLNNFLVEFFDPQGTSTSSAPWRTISSKKHAELIGKAFGAPFLSCVKGLEDANSISDVLDAILAFSAAYVSQEQILRRFGEESDCEDGYFQNRQVFDCGQSKRNDKKWLRRQVNCAGSKCQAAAESISEVAKAGARMLSGDKLNSEAEEKAEVNTSISNMDEGYEVNSNFKPENLKYHPLNWDDVPESSEAGHSVNLECPGSDFAIRLDGILPECDGNVTDDSDNYTNSWCKLSRVVGSCGQSDLGGDSCSESSWEIVRSQKNESNVEDDAYDLGAEISDAECLGKKLENLDPFGKHEFINDFLNLNVNSPESSSSSDQHVFERLASISSSNSSNWTDYEINPSASSMNKMRTAKLQTVTEEHPIDREISRLSRNFLRQSVLEGNVLQWCSCKFSESSCSVIELKFLVGSFMEEDIATLSIGISRASPLYVKIFLGANNFRENLLKGDVRITVDQGAPFCSGVTWKGKVAVETPVVGLSCYIPHLVRHYLKQDVQERFIRGYEFSDGEVLTGLMTYVVAQLMFMKETCCICNHQTQPEELTSIVPRTCEKPICQALYNAWIAVAPPMVLELSHVQDWLKACFDERALDVVSRYYYVSGGDDYKYRSYNGKIERVAKWLAEKTCGSWLKVNIPKPLEETNEEGETSSGKHTRLTKKRRTCQYENSPLSMNQFFAFDIEKSSGEHS